LAENEILLLHLGGLGDVCLSESVFLSLRNHFGDNIVAVGTKRFFRLFPAEYFLRIHGVESRHWLYLFSKEPMDIRWKRVIFIGKDRQGDLRRRWQEISLDPVIFIDMYPDKAVSYQQSAFGTPNDENEKVHVEEYQLAQLAQFAIEAVKKEIPRQRSPRAILYPERGFEKEKWEPEHFMTLYRSLRSKGIQAHMMVPAGLQTDVEEAVRIDDLNDVWSFFKGGGIFVSNDSGMAHLAGVSGLFTITIFTDYDPRVWHPRGSNISLQRGVDLFGCNTIEKIILDNL